MSKKIAVLLGGTSAERDVSLVTGMEISKSLHNLGHQVCAIDCAYGDRIIDFQNVEIEQLIQATPPDYLKTQKALNLNLFSTIQFLLQEKFDLVFLALHGGYGENGQIQAMLELADIPFTGSGSSASSISMNKHQSKVFFRQYDTPTADWYFLEKPDEYRPFMAKQLGFPFVCKPADQGSTVGLSIVRSEAEITAAISLGFEHAESVILEAFIDGRELTVPVLGNEVLPVIEIIPEHGIYDYECKYQSGKSQYVVPADIDPGIAKELQQNALAVFRLLGCRHYARIDYRLDNSNRPFCLEINTLPGMTPTSLVPKAAKINGYSFEKLLEKIVYLAGIDKNAG